MSVHIRDAARAAIVVVLALVAGCAGKEPVKVRFEVGAVAADARYHTYAWRSPAAPGPASSAGIVTRRDWRIRGIVDRLLTRKGYVATAEAPDFLVDYELDEKHKETSSVGEYYNYHNAGGAKGLNEAFTFGYLEGALALGMFDGPTQRLVWRASATIFTDQSDSDARIAEALQRMLSRWPSRQSDEQSDVGVLN